MNKTRVTYSPAQKCSVTEESRARHFLSVDVEDWRQSTLDRSSPVTERVVRNTHTLLGLFADAGALATFFILGLVAEQFPGLVRDIAREGHEIASHGYKHVSAEQLTPAQFAEDLNRALNTTEDAAGVRVKGFRAPDFSITRNTLWAYGVLEDTGLAYDSSVVPVWNPRYGIRGTSRMPYQVTGVWEVPIGTFRIGPMRFPLGGGYMRVCPLMLIQRELAQTVGQVLYVHPYELDPTELQDAPRISMRMRVTQGVGRGSTERKLRELLRTFVWQRLDTIVQ